MEYGEQRETPLGSQKRQGRQSRLPLPTSTLGQHLAGMRTRRGWKLEALAWHVGIDRSTLWRWENAVSIPPLEGVVTLLAALNASPEEKLVVLAALPGKSGSTGLRALAEERSFGLESLVPSPGAAFRFLRLRRGWSQAEVARRLQVSRSSVSRWEAGNMSPDAAILPRIAAVLGADEDDARLIGGEDPLLMPGGLVSPETGRDETAHILDQVREAVWRGETGLTNLTFWGIEAALWRQEVKSPSDATRSLLAKAYVTHGDWLDRAGRRSEMQPLASQVLCLLPHGYIPEGEDWWMGAVLHQVRVWRHTPGHPAGAPEANAQSRLLLLRHLETVTGVQRCALLRDLADVSADSGSFEAALGYIRLARREAQRMGDEGMAGVLCRFIEARILERAGKAQGNDKLFGQALETLPSFDEVKQDPSQQISLAVTQAGLLYQNGASSAASENLHYAYSLIHLHGYAYLLPAADALADNLG
jgi:transcriptional regulator with XRE-family HTH domain